MTPTVNSLSPLYGSSTAQSPGIVAVRCVVEPTATMHATSASREVCRFVRLLLHNQALPLRPQFSSLSIAIHESRTMVSLLPPTSCPTHHAHPFRINSAPSNLREARRSRLRREAVVSGIVSCLCSYRYTFYTLFFNSAARCLQCCTSCVLHFCRIVLRLLHNQRHISPGQL